MCHLQRRHRAALAKEDTDKAKALLEIIMKERKIKRWRIMHDVADKRYGQSVLSVKVPIVDAEVNNKRRECTTQQFV